MLGYICHLQSIPMVSYMLLSHGSQAVQTSKFSAVRVPMDTCEMFYIKRFWKCLTLEKDKRHLPLNLTTTSNTERIFFGGATLATFWIQTYFGFFTNTCRKPFDVILQNFLDKYQTSFLLLRLLLLLFLLAIKMKRNNFGFVKVCGQRCTSIKLSGGH
jgi:hypothetical protein